MKGPTAICHVARIPTSLYFFLPTSFSMEMALASPKPERATAEEEEDLFRAAAAGESRIFSSLSRQQLQLSRSLRNEDGRSLLHVAASSGHTEVKSLPIPPLHASSHILSHCFSISTSRASIYSYINESTPLVL